MSQSNQPFRHYDPAVLQTMKALELAEQSKANPDVIKAIKTALEFVQMREDFTDYGTTKESETCTKLAELSKNHDWEKAHKEGKTIWLLKPQMLSGSLEGQFLKSLVSMHNAEKVLDVGMFTGYSALSMAEALPANGQMVTIDMDKYLQPLVDNVFKESNHYRKIKIIIASALETMKDLFKKGEQFDIIFLDANKGEYIEYMDIAFGGLLKPRGTILVDNAFRHGDGYLPSTGDNVTKQFAANVVARKDLHTVLVPIRDGVMMIRRLSDVEGSL